MTSTSRPTHREIERKFLVRRMPENIERFPHAQIEQGYLAIERNGVQVRLRRRDGHCSLTYKRNDRAARVEREVELTPQQFDVLWPATEGRRLTKTRYDVPHGSLTVEIDIYSGRHQGLIVAEVEFEKERAARAFEPPPWLGREVTGSPRYSNIRLARA